jgi:hypothetical protein
MKKTILPGKSVGKLHLGMTVTQARRLCGKPHSEERVGLSTHKKPKPTPTPYKELLWWEGGTADDPESWLVALVNKETILQLSVMGTDYQLPTRLSTVSDFTQVRKAYPKLTVHAGYFGSEDEPGYVGYFFDAPRQGLAFTIGTQDDISTYNGLPKASPESIVVHPAGQSVLLIEHGLQGLPEKPLGETSQRISTWLAGGALRPL